MNKKALLLAMKRCMQKIT